MQNASTNASNAGTNASTEPRMLLILRKADDELVAVLPKDEAMARWSKHNGDDYRLVTPPYAKLGEQEKQCLDPEKWNAVVADPTFAARGMTFHWQRLPKGWALPNRFTAPVEPTAPVVPVGKVDETRAAEQRALGKDLAKAGFEWAIGGGLTQRLWYDGGTAMMGSGEQRRFSLQKTHADMQDAVPALKGFINHIATEDRRAGVVDITEMVATPTDGGITLHRRNSGKGAVRLEPYALEQILDRYPKAFPSAKKLFKVMTSESMAKVFNDQVARLPRSWGSSVAAGQLPPSKFNFGFRNIEGEWRIYRAASDVYLEMPAAMVAQAYIDEIEALGLPNAKASVKYDPVTTEVVIEVSWHDPRKRQPRVGDPIEFGFKGSTSDRGGKAHRSSGYTKQIQCVNCTILVRVSGATKQNHRGGRNATSAASIAKGMAKVRAAIRNTIRQHEQGVNVLLGHWGLLDATPLAAFGDTPLKAFEALVADPSLKGKGVTAMDLMNAYRNRPAGQPGDNGMAIANALTQAAHTSSLTPFKQKTLEEVIGIQVLPALAGAAKRHKAEAAKKAALV